MVVEATQTGEMNIMVKKDEMVTENDQNNHVVKTDHIVVKSGSVYGKDVVDYFRDAVNILIFNRLDRIECKEWKVGRFFSAAFFVFSLFCISEFPSSRRFQYLFP